MRELALICVILGACAAPGPGSGGDDGGDDGIDACPCPDDDGGGGGGDGSDPGGCEGNAGEASQPFGGATADYADGAILPDRDNLERAVRDFYDRWRDNYLEQGCGDGRWYVATGHDNGMTVSEAHGYGMIVMAYMAGHEPDAKEIFDGMVAYYTDHPSEITPSLMAWSQDHSCNNNNGAASASDGDLDIAYALLLADKQWSSGGAIDYRGEAERILDGIRSGEIDGGGSYVLLGDWVNGAHYDATRTSDFMPSHLESFATATGDPVWRQIADRTYDMIETLQSEHAPDTGLLPDFVTSPTTDPTPAYPGFLENPTDGDYSYNACRDPWRIALDFLINGDARARAAAGRMNAWIRAETGGDPWAILPGYQLDGDSLGRDYDDMAFIAPFGVAAMVDADNQAWLNSLWDAVVAAGDGGYFGDTIKLLSMIAMSGNWWAPEAAPCPS
jgi:endo-1,4-beta-D-glucanase Y